MVSPAYYPEGRRYSRLDPTYSYPERQQRHSHSSEARTSTMTEREPETDTPPRKRIAVACGRCRKRKIRCSGDTGNGLPCQNCKAAGAESCMFLRVASTEAPWVQTPEFAYELKAARAYQAQQAMASPLTASPPHYASDMHDSLTRYPPTSTGYSSYGGGGKYYPAAATMSSWSSTPGYSDDGTSSVDYSAATMGYSYPYQSHDPGYYYRMTAKAAVPSSGDMYVNADATTGYSYGSSGASLVHRPAVSAVQSEGSNFSLSNVAASLPQAGGDRMLPNPASRLPNTSVLAYRTEGGVSAPSYAASSSTKSSGSPISQTSPTSAVSEVTTGYSTSTAGSGSYDSSPVTAYPPPVHTLPSMSHHRLSNVADMTGYPPSSASSGDSIFSASETSLRTHGSASELSYKYTDGSSATSSVGRRGSGETSSSGGSLSNGQQYTVTTPSAGMYGSVAGHGRHHVSQYMISEDVSAEHYANRRSAGGLSAS
ncbi:putative transcriptional regulatory protein [Colletotrichum spaethianum]|uniref:Transcriptional regulatory protein n=1 Tax=Colletotrichum spaethianum TaxID=700344 RepID=A0AA37NZT3_9PEZI|nr:putative transcriptional regulatory protein [Colletotrichum spaethianum]GKT44810.1 putative transcriptional regulatory protein [Colletotrichum spaethianum]